MKKKIIFALIIGAICAVTIGMVTVSATTTVASGECGAGLSWRIYDDGELNISGQGSMYSYGMVSDVPWSYYSSSIKKVTIEYGATSICNFAFYDCSNITSVSVPKSVTIIGSYSFYNCDGLKSITIPDSVTELGGYAFAGCDGLTSVTVPKSVTNIIDGAFSNCSRLSSIKVDADNNVYSNDSYGVLFNKNKTVLKQYPIGNTRNTYDIPAGVTNIAPYAFSGCTSLTGVTIPEGTISIGSEAFRFCSGIKNITIPKSVTAVGGYAFANCYSLVGVEIADGVKSIGASAFYNCYSLTDVTIPKSVTSIGSGAFDSCSGLSKCSVYSKDVKFTDSVFYDVPSSFELHGYTGSTTETYAKNNLHTFVPFPRTAIASGICGDELAWKLYDDGELVIDGTGNMYDWDNVPSVPWYGNIGNIKKITVGDSVTSIGSYAFASLNSASTVTIGDGVTSIGDYALSYCSGITSVTIPGSVRDIGEGAFFDTPITSISIPDSVTSIGERAFFAGTLKNITVDSNNMAYYSTGGVLFNKDKTRLIQYPIGNARSAYSIPDSVTSIARYAFYNCDGLTDIDIPDDITTIAIYAFYDCDGISRVTVPADTEVIGNYAFYSCDSLTSATVYSDDVYFGTEVFTNPASDFEIRGYTDSTAEAYASENEHIFVALRKVTDSGTCGDNLTWTLYEDGELVIDGTGSMYNYSGSNNVTDAPWGQYIDAISKLTVNDGITHIGNSALLGCSSIAGSLIIPDSVISIGSNAFSSCCGLTGNLVIPGSVTSIGSNAFYECKGFGGSLVIPNSISVIDAYTFYGCSGFDGSLTIGSSVTTIGASAFDGCKGFTGNLVIPDSVKTVEFAAFKNCSGFDGTLSFGKGLTALGASSFYNCTGFTSGIVIPDGVTDIGSYAFYNCSSLTVITVYGREAAFGKDVFSHIPDPFEIHAYADSSAQAYASANEHKFVVIREIIASGACGNNLTWALYKDGELVIDGTGDMYNTYSYGDAPWYSSRSVVTRVTLGDGVTSIGNCAFYDCTNLADVIIPDSVTAIGNSAFYDCDGLASITIPNSVEYIGSKIFYSCDTLASVSLSKNVNVISEMAFAHCNNLVGVTIPDGVEAIGDYAFGECDKLERVTIPSSITSIGNGAFSGSSSLKNVILPESVEVIGDYAFEFCTGLTAITIPKRVTSIGDCTFSHCQNLVNINLHDNITSIGDQAFRNCTGLTKIVFPGKLTIIGDQAFEGCTVLESAPLPETVTAIGNQTFSGCVGLTSVTLPGKLTEIGYQVFNGCAGLTGVTIPGSVTTIGREAFAGCTGLSSITVPDKVEYIGISAFNGCTGLEKATVYTRNAEFCSGVFFYVTSDFEIYGYSASTAETYAKANSHDFVPFVENVTDSSTENKKAHTIQFVDSEFGTPIANVQVSIAGMTGAAGSTGKVTFLMATSSSADLTAAAKDYAMVNIPGYSVHLNYGFNVIAMTPVGETKIIPLSCNGISISTSRAQINNKAKLVADISISGNSIGEIKKYQLRQGNTVLGESTTGNFRIDNSKFTEGTAVTAYMYTSRGIITKVLNIDVVSFEFADSAYTIGFQQMKIPDNVPLIGGFEIEPGVEIVDAEFEASNTQLKIGYNHSVKGEQDISKLNAGLREWMDRHRREVPSSKFSVDLCGFVVVDVGNRGVKSTTGTVAISINYSNGFAKTFFLVVPLRAEVEFGLKGEIFIRDIGFDWENGDLILPQAGFLVEGNLTARGGFGGWFASAGVYGKAGLAMKGDLFPEIAIDSIIANGKMGLYAKAFLLGEVRLPLFNGTVTLYERESYAAYARRNLATAIYDEDSYTLASRDYLNIQSTWDGAVTGTLKSGVSSLADPLIAAAGDVTLMVWLDDNAESDDYNYQQLMYSVLTEDGWSTPASVDTNSFNDAEYELCSDGENIWLAYTETNRAIIVDDDMSAMAGTLELVVCRYDVTSGAFIERTVITNDSTMDSKPNITVIDGIPTVVWINNANNNIFGMSDGNTVYMSEYSSGAWSAPAIIVDNTSAVMSIDAGLLGESLAISVIYDSDSDFSTANDSVLAVYNQSGEGFAYGESSYANVLFDSGRIYWSDADSIYSIGAMGEEGELLTDKIGADNAFDFDIISANGRTYLLYRVYNTEDENGGSDIYTIIIDADGVCSPIRLTETEGYIDSFSSLDTADGITIVYRRTDAAFIDGDVITASDICSLVFTPSIKLEIADFWFDYKDLFDGGNVTLTVSVRNNGAMTANGFEISCGTAVLAECSDCIKTGETAEIEIEHTLVGNDSGYTFTVTDELGATDDGMITLGYVDFAVLADSLLIDNKPYVNINIANEGNISGSGVLNVHAGDADGEVIYTEYVSLCAEELRYILLEIIDNDVDQVYVELVTASEDYFDGDNYTVCDIYRGADATKEITASGTCGDDLTWILYDDGELVIEGTGDMWGMQSQAAWEDYFDQINAVTIGNEVTSIGDFAFFGYVNLERVTVGIGVTSIGDYAFSSCDSLTAVSVPAGVTSIGKKTFTSCDSLEGIFVNENNAAYSSDEHGVLLNKNKTTLIQYPVGRAEATYTIPDSVTSIGEYAFVDCPNLVSADIGVSVINIGDSAFAYCSNLASVDIGDSVTSIGDMAFYECDNLASVTIPDSVTSIGTHAFGCCDNLEHIAIGSGVTRIDVYAFDRSLRLTSINVDANNAVYSNDENGVLFNKDKTTIVRYPEGSTSTAYTIPDSVTSICDNAFAWCDNLAAIEIPGSVTSIGNRAFYDCDALSSIVIPESVTSIGDYAFAYMMSCPIPISPVGVLPGGSSTVVTTEVHECQRLAKAIIYSKNVEFGSQVFSALHDTFELHGYTGSTTEAYASANGHIFVALEESVPEQTITASGECGNLAWNLTADGEITITGDGALTDITANTPWSEYRSAITTVTIGEGVTAIDNIAFSFCKNLTAINVDEDNPSYTSIDGVLFTKDGAMICYPTGKADTSYTIPEGTTAITGYAFRTCENLASVTIPDSVTTIGNYAFWGCENIETITVGEGVTSIGARVFSYCDNLTLIEVDAANVKYTTVDGVLYTKDMKTLVAYPAGKADTSYTIPEGVTRIMNYAFSGCSNLASVTLPASMKTVGNCVFDGCASLTAINVAEGNKRYTAIDGVLYNKDMTALLYYPAGKPDTEFTVPETVTEIGRYAFTDCDNLVTVNVGEGVTSIGYMAFAYCDKLTNINYAGTEAEWNAIPKGSCWNRYLDGDEVKFGA